MSPAQRIAGSRHSLSASFTSSWPARRHVLVQAKQRASCVVLSNAVFDRNLPALRAICRCPKSVKGVILATKPPGSWRMSVESLAHQSTGMSQGYSA